MVIYRRKGRGGKRGSRRDHRNVKPIPLPQIDVGVVVDQTCIVIHNTLFLKPGIVIILEPSSLPSSGVYGNSQDRL